MGERDTINLSINFEQEAYKLNSFKTKQAAIEILLLVIINFNLT